MNFSDILASVIHDMKNSLGMILNTLEELSSDPASGLAHNPKAVTLQLQARRANDDLIQLLTLYKIGNERLSLNLVEHNLDDLLAEIVLEHRPLAEAQGIRLDYECDPYLSAYFDEDLVRGALNNAIGNAARYTQDRLLLSADTEDGYTVLRVEDNGRGFPQSMIDAQLEMDGDLADSFTRGHTHLGLFFCSQIAHQHRNRERSGMVRLCNGFHLPGGCFSLWLP